MIFTTDGRYEVHQSGREEVVNLLAQCERIEKRKKFIKGRVNVLFDE